VVSLCSVSRRRSAIRAWIFATFNRALPQFAEPFSFACEECAEGVITDVVLDEPFRDCGLGTRALSHLRSQHPGVTWHTTLEKRLTRDLPHWMRIPKTAVGGTCSHLRSVVVAPADS
jgi:hypothetical protein